MLLLLLKLNFREKLSGLKKGGRFSDVLGTVLSLLLAGGGIFIVVWVFSDFVQKYTLIEIDGIYDPLSRQFELTAFVYEVVFVLGLISAVSQINRAVFQSEDREILSALPVKASTIFYSKLLLIYLRQTAVCFVVLIPLNMSFAAVTGQSAYYILLTLLSCLVFPLITIFFASALALPLYIVKRALQSRYLLLLLLATAVIGLCFWAYADILEFIQNLMTTGEIKFFFSEKTMIAIAKISEWLFPANLMAGILTKRDAALNAGVFAAVAALLGAGGFFIVKALLGKPSSELYCGLKTKKHNKAKKVLKPSAKKKPVLIALIVKEAEQIARTPSYAVQYFSVAALMPLMVYFCMDMGSELLSSMLFVEKNFELAIFLTALFGTLTNTFCATNISRDGRVFANLKTMPLKTRDVIGAKLLLNAAVALFAVAASCVTLSATGYISALQAAFVFLIGTLLSVAQICFATKLDLKNPSFGSDEKYAVRESGATVSAVIVCGLLSALAAGGIPLVYSVLSAFSQSTSSVFTYAFSFAFAACAASLACAYLFVGLDKSFAELSDEAR